MGNNGGYGSNTEVIVENNNGGGYGGNTEVIVEINNNGYGETVADAVADDIMDAVVDENPNNGYGETVVVENQGYGGETVVVEENADGGYGGGQGYGGY